MRIANFFAYLEKQNQLFKSLLGFITVGMIGTVDFLTGHELSFSVFYVIPISLITWFVSYRLGIIASIVSAWVWLWADLSSGSIYSHSLIPVWNSLIRFIFFLIITLLLSRVKNDMEREKKLSRTDNLTGAANSRFFFELLQMEVDRFQRYQRPFTLAYIDLDNFKAVNNSFGHPIGDQVLYTIVSHARKKLRKTDIIARLGGDEFVLLLPETDQDSARIVLPKFQSNLLEEMQRNQWPVTFSIGVLTCSIGPFDANKLIGLADKLMYDVKNSGKNSLKYHTC
ncbi:MAG: GGDEF domain-containing protein [Synechococcales bacterium]|nr:GGDEF domain-containing protein [Synechococcales bacterium]